MSLVLVPQIRHHVLKASSVAKAKIYAQPFLLAISPQKDNSQQFVLMGGIPKVAQIPAISAQLAPSAQKIQFPLCHLSTILFRVTHT